MDKKGIAFTTMVLIGLLVSALGVGIYVYNGGEIPFIVQSVLPTSGCDFIPSTDNPSSLYTEIITNSRYTCEADECIVQGVIEVDGVSTGGQECCVQDGISCCRQLTPTKKTCRNSQFCWDATVTSFEAEFNFCPTENFPQCQGTRNVVNGEGQQVTDKYKMSKGQTLTFDPVYVADGSSVAVKSIRVEKYDCSCLPAVEDGQACDSNKLLCTQEWQLKPGGEPSHARFCVDPPISNTNTRSSLCELSTNIFQRCDATQEIGQSTCGDWGTESTCSTGQQCFVDATGETGAGIGGCRCPSDPCILGEKRATGTNKFQECITVGNCLQWSTDDYCADGLIFNDVLDDCFCDTTDSCVSGESECIGDDIRTCEPKFIGGKTCYEWSNTQSCDGSKECSNRGTEELDDVCSCEGVSTCESGDIKCTSATTYDVCSRDPTVPGSCEKFRDFGDTVSNLEECKNDNIVERKDIGCGFPQSPNFVEDFKCDINTDKNNIKYEVCGSNNVNCVAVDDEFTATESDFLSGKKVCISNDVHSSAKYNTRDNSIYRWELEKSCTGSTNICSNGKCVSSLEDIFFECNNNPECEFTVTQDLKNISLTIKRTPESDFKGGTITVSLVKNGEEFAREQVEFFGNTEVATFDVDLVKSAPIGVYELTADVDEFNTVKKTILIQKGLIIDVICPPIVITGREVECIIKVTDGTSKNTITTLDNINAVVLQGDNELIDTITSNAIKFTPMEEIVGSVDIFIEANKDGFVSGNTRVNVPVNDPTISSFFEVDNTDFFSFSRGISSGTHKLTLHFEESGEELDIFTINSNIRTPAGQVVPLSFTEKGGGDWETSFDFEQAGQSYKLEGDVQFEDISKDDLHFEYLVLTSSGVEEPYIASINLIIIFVVVGIVLLIGFIILITFLTRRK